MSKPTGRHKGVRVKPPRNTRFKKGQSGNPRGRPKGSRNFVTALNEELEQKIIVREDGVARKISKREAVLKSLFAQALQGDKRAQQLVLSLSERFADNTNPEPDPKIEESDIELLRKFLPNLIELAKPDGGTNDDHSD